MHGFLNINKPAGLTSHDVVARVRRLAGRGVKVGHAGTLDPAATGVLPVALGQATRLIEYLADAHKGYRAVVRFGITTTTDDAEGEIIEQRAVPSLDARTLEKALARFRGPIMQTPPMYSALHHEGKRLYDLARAGETVERAPRPVTIDELRLADIKPPFCTLDIVCSKGTYIRALARDLGEALRCGAHLAALERTFVGSFRLEQAISLAALEHGEGLLASSLWPPEIAVIDWPKIELDVTQSQRVRNGLMLQLAGAAGEQARAHGPDGALIALLRRTDIGWKPEKVFS